MVESEIVNSLKKIKECDNVEVKPDLGPISAIKVNAKTKLPLSNKSSQPYNNGIVSLDNDERNNRQLDCIDNINLGNDNCDSNGAFEGNKSVKNCKCVRRLISSDSGGSNKSSFSKGGVTKIRHGRPPPQAPPDGGWGWVVVFASFMISLIADGVSLSYGFFQMDLSDHFGESKGKTALVGSLLLSMPALTGPIASALTDRYGCRSMTILSGLLSASGFILGSFARKLEHLFIAFSITGIGLSLSYVTSIVIVAYYFNTKRSLATGLAVCGTGIGTFLFAPLTTYLLKEYSWRGTLLIMSGFFLNIIVFGALMRDINVSEFDSLEGQESDSDEDSVIEPSNGNGLRSCGDYPHHHCCHLHHNQHLIHQKTCCDATFDCNTASRCSTVDVNKSSYPLSSITPNLETECFCKTKFSSQLNPLSSSPSSSNNKLDNGCSKKPFSSICINSHCCSSIFPDDEQLCKLEANCKAKTLFQDQTADLMHAHQPTNHQNQCNHQTNQHRRFQRFQSSYNSSAPKSDLRNYSSLVNIPTYITTKGLVSKDVLDEISGRKDGNLNQLLQKYPNLLSLLVNRDHEKSLFFSSSAIGQKTGKDEGPIRAQDGSRANETIGSNNLNKQNKIYNGLSINNSNNSNGVDSKRRLKGDIEAGPSLPRNHGNRFKNIAVNPFGNNCFTNNGLGNVLTGRDGGGGLGLKNMQRASLTYRTAVFRDVRRYRLRSSSAPDIFTNSMVTISERENFFYDIKQVIVDSVDLSIFKNIRFAIFCLSNLLLHGCIDVPYVYLPDHAISSGVCVKEMAFYLISVLGIANTLGTIIVGYIGDKPWLRPSTWYSGLTALGGISMALIPLARNYYLLAVLAAFYGFSVSANYTLVSVILVDIISLDKFTNAYGLMLLVQGIASMLGPPIAGWLFDISGDYNTTFYVIGLCVFASGTIVFPLNESRTSFSSSHPSTSPSSRNGSSMMESPSRTSSPLEDKLAASSSNKTLFDKEPLP